ncbi:MAG TPA: helix-turn-helix domain-containing protein [Solirubrobacteraceae bacterium]
MRALLQRLSGLDDVAESAVRIIELFDKLAQERLSLADLVRSAALFSECPIGVSDPDGTVVLRISVDGQRLELQRPETAVGQPVDGGGDVWLERDGPPLALDELVLERFATAVALARKREAVQPRAGDPALVELMLSPDTDEADRMRAIQLFGLVPTSPIRALVVAGRATEVLGRCARPLGKSPIGDVLAVIVFGDEDLRVRLKHLAAGVRVGVGPRVPAGEAWRSWQAARLAARLADGASRTGAGCSERDPGVVFWDDLGGLATVAEYVPTEAISQIPDVIALDQLASERTGTVTLDALRALCEAESIRLAARTMHMHHSSMGQRLDHAEQTLGFSVRPAPGRHRLALAMALRRLRDNAG